MDAFLNLSWFLKKWSFETEEGEIPILPQQKKEKNNIPPETRQSGSTDILMELGGFCVTISSFSDVYGYPLVQAERIRIDAAPHAFFIIDRIKSSKPIRVHAHFVANNIGGSLKTNVAAVTKLVFRRNPAAMKFFQIYSASDQVVIPCWLSFVWGCPYDRFSLSPDPDNGYSADDTLAFNYTSDGYGMNHVMAYAAAVDHIDKIIGWHIKTEACNLFHIEPPEKSGGYVMELKDNGEIILENLNNAISCKIVGDSLVYT